MCCRFYTDDGTKKEIISLVSGYDRRIDWLREGDIRPSETATVITGEAPGLYARDMRWGFEAPEGKLLINARAESAARKRSFAESLACRRLVVPAAGFYEWERSKNRVSFTLPGGSVLYLAGIWKPAVPGEGPVSGKDPAAPGKDPAAPGKDPAEDRFTILTTAANASMQPVHDRMPLVLRKDQVLSWIMDPGKTEEFLGIIPPELTLSREYEQLDLFSFLG